jgi:hypothetical protein
MDLASSATFVVARSNFGAASWWRKAEQKVVTDGFDAISSTPICPPEWPHKERTKAQHR